MKVAGGQPQLQDLLLVYEDCCEHYVRLPYVSSWVGLHEWNSAVVVVNSEIFSGGLPSAMSLALGNEVCLVVTLASARLLHIMRAWQSSYFANSDFA